MEGRKQGYDQILWLLGPDYQVTEAGASNFFLIWKTKEGEFNVLPGPPNLQRTWLLRNCFSTTSE